MKAVIYKDTKTVEVQERAMPVCGPDDVIVRNVRGGICGTDITGYLYGGRLVGFVPNTEFGHEMVGYVYKTGENVTCVEKGARVFVNPMTRLRTADPSASVRAGGFSQYVLVQEARLEDNLFLLPDTLSFEDAVLIEPFSVGTHGKNTAEPTASLAGSVQANRLTKCPVLSRTDIIAGNAPVPHLPGTYTHHATRPRSPIRDLCHGQI